jgi:hypothetical protein
MRIRLMLLMLVCLTGFELHAQKVDVDSLLKQALYETNEKSDYPKAMVIAKKALAISPTYTDVKLLVGRLYRLTDKPDSARIMFNEVLLAEPNNADAASYLTNLTIAERQHKIDSLKNRVSITYNPTFFEKEGKESWNLLNVYYGRMTKYGTIIGRINYADRSYADGFQFELEAYPKHKNGYSFVNFAYSNAAIFQKHRAAYSYLQNFKGGWEGESYALTGRYYLNTADDYFTAIVGTGVSPDDRTRNFQFSERLRNESFRLSLGYQQLLWKRNVIGILGTYNREEYVADRKENEYDISINFQHRF